MMRNRYLFYITALFALSFFSCKESEKEHNQKAVDLISVQTLGLGYLEEFKLPEAEHEFLKFIELAPQDKIGYANLGLTYLRMGNYPEAKKQLFKAIKIDSKDADIRLLLATVYQIDDKREQAIAELKKATAFAPNHIKILYALSELFASQNDISSQKQHEKYLLQLVEKAPGNLVSHLNLTEIYIRKSEYDKATEQLEIIHKQFPEFPKEAAEYFDKTTVLLKKKDAEKAVIPFTIFNNYLKVTAPYQASIFDLKGPGGSLIGFPIITYNTQTTSRIDGNESILDVLKFTNITASAGLDVIPTFAEDENTESKNFTHLVTADYDGSGNTDLYVTNFDSKSNVYKHYLFKNDMVKFKDVSNEAGLKHSGEETSATFADYDNDGFLDLYIVKNGGDILYKNNGNGRFEVAKSSANIGSKNGANKALFVDLDHDGDLDLFEAKSGSNLVFRNNGDGSFKEQAAIMGLSGDGGNAKDASFGDFDDDGDIDLFVVNENTGNRLYSNQRQGIFKDLTEASGLKSKTGSSTVSVGDFNNDGFLDLFLTSLNNGNNELYQNIGNGHFKIAKNSQKMFASLQQIKVYDTQFFDFDNDGFLDIIAVGAPKQKNGRGIFLYHNNQKGSFTDVSKLLPEKPKLGRQIALFDYNDDGDLDLIIAGLNGGLSLLRNDGGSLNHYVKMKLVGLRAGSSKNNYFGIGAKVEMRAGNLYQTMVVNNPTIHFGLGNHAKADVIRITWTNGVPQNIFLPEADQALIEAQTLKGSCPFLYTWNGEKYVFAKDIIWRSALGMPLGIMGGKSMHAFPDASDDYIKIAGEQLKPKNGEYAIQITSELWETIYIDKIQLVAVDHPDSIDVFVPEQFSPPPFPGMEIYQVKKKFKPFAATDTHGNNVLPFILEKDDKYLSDFKPGKYQGTTETHDLILNPGAIGQNKNLFIFLNGWIFPTDASINLALSQSDNFKLIRPSIQVINKKGEWETVIENLGFPMGKDKTVIANLSGKFLSNDHRIRIQTNMEIYWDEIFFSEDYSKSSLIITVLNPTSANIHYRGFSSTYKKGGRYGPHWFDYYHVEKNTKWRDLTGNYTRYGDVLPLLMVSDNQYIISNAGDETSIKFNAKILPELQKGWKRDFLIHSIGWVKDGDINTALGSTVLPLPFHGMSSYPPSEKDFYPKAELQKYNQKYNTRTVSPNDYRLAIKNKY